MARSSAAEVLAAALRGAILDGALAGGERLREQALAGEHDVARHTVRAALRLLEGEGLVVIAPNAGARVAALDPAGIADLSLTRTLLEVGAVRLALARGPLPPSVHAAAARFAAVCRGEGADVGPHAPHRPSGPAGDDADGAALGPPQPAREPSWGAVVLEHARFHEALVAAAGSPRLTRAHAALSSELALFLVQGRPHYALASLAEDHLGLVTALERTGPGALEEHLAASAAALLGR